MNKNMCNFMLTPCVQGGVNNPYSLVLNIPRENTSYC